MLYVVVLQHYVKAWIVYYFFTFFHDKHHCGQDFHIIFRTENILLLHTLKVEDLQKKSSIHVVVVEVSSKL